MACLWLARVFYCFLNDLSIVLYGVLCVSMMFSSVSYGLSIVF